MGGGGLLHKATNLVLKTFLVPLKPHLVLYSNTFWQRMKKYKYHTERKIHWQCCNCCEEGDQRSGIWLLVLYLSWDSHHIKTSLTIMHCVYIFLDYRRETMLVLWIVGVCVGDIFWSFPFFCCCPVERKHALSCHVQLFDISWISMVQACCH